MTVRKRDGYSVNGPQVPLTFYQNRDPQDLETKERRSNRKKNIESLREEFLHRFEISLASFSSSLA